MACNRASASRRREATGAHTSTYCRRSRPRHHLHRSMCCCRARTNNCSTLPSPPRRIGTCPSPEPVESGHPNLDLLPSNQDEFGLVCVALQLLLPKLPSPFPPWPSMNVVMRRWSPCCPEVVYYNHHRPFPTELWAAQQQKQDQKEKEDEVLVGSKSR